MAAATRREHAACPSPRCPGAPERGRGRAPPGQPLAAPELREPLGPLRPRLPLRRPQGGAPAPRVARGPLRARRQAQSHRAQRQPIARAVRRRGRGELQRPHRRMAGAQKVRPVWASSHGQASALSDKSQSMSTAGPVDRRTSPAQRFRRALALRLRDPRLVLAARGAGRAARFFAFEARRDRPLEAGS